MTIRSFDFISGPESDTIPDAGTVESSTAVTKGISYTVLDDDGYGTIIMTGAGTTVTLPTASANDNRRLIIVNDSSGSVTVDGEGAETINGALTYLLTYNGNSIQLLCNGTEWFISGIHKEELNISTKSSDYVILDNDGYDLIIFDDTSSNRTCTLPTAADNTGRVIKIKNISTDKGLINVDGEGAETIDGYTDIDLDCKFSYLKIVSNGTSWEILDYHFTDKQYTLTIVGGTSTVRAVGTPYRGIDGIWNLKYNFEVNVSSATRTDITLTISNTVFKAGPKQACSSSHNSGSKVGLHARTTPSSGAIDIAHQSVNTSGYRVSGDNELNIKPTYVE